MVTKKIDAAAAPAVGAASHTSRLLPATLALAGGSVAAAIAFLVLHGPLVPGDTGLGAAIPGFAAHTAPEAMATQAPPGRSPAAAADSDSDDEPLDYAAQREEDLRIQRLDDEMRPNTPGVTGDQFVQAADDDDPDSPFMSPEEEAATYGP